MGDIIELLEQVQHETELPESIIHSNLYSYLLDKEYIDTSSDSKNTLGIALTEKGSYYLHALHLLRLHQTPHNFLEREGSKSVLSLLENNGYIVINNKESLQPCYEITDAGEALLESLKS